MLRANKSWDVRCPAALQRMFPKAKRSGYYYKVDRVQARKIVSILSRAYCVSVPVVTEEHPVGCNGWCESTYHAPAKAYYSKIAVHARGHMKTVFHEWYHHLDAATLGKYNSSDAKQYAWEFADRLFDALRGKVSPHDTSKAKAQSLSRYKGARA